MTLVLLVVLRSAAAYGAIHTPCLARTRRNLRHKTLVCVATTDDTNPVKWSDALVLPNNDDNEQLLRIRHSTAHVMAMAVQKLFKGTKVSIGPWIEKVCFLSSPRSTQARYADAADVQESLRD